MISRERIKVSGNVLSVSNVELFEERQSRSTPGRRASVDFFSDQSAARMRRYLREAKAEYTTMLTLTYPLQFDVSGPAAKNHLRRFIQECKRYYERHTGHLDGWGMFWFMEFTDAGQIHFHLFSTARIPYQWVAQTWFGITNTGIFEHLGAGTRIEAFRNKNGGFQSYAAKYANKQSQKVVPDGFVECGRFWGIAGEKGRVAAVLLVDKTDVLNSRQQQSIAALYRRIKGDLHQGHSKSLDEFKKFGVLVYVYPISWSMDLLLAEINEVISACC